MGKPLREARLEALRAATILRYAAGEACRPIGEMYEPSVAEPAALHAAPPARRRRPDHALELPDRDPGLEARACAHLRQHASCSSSATRRRAPGCTSPSASPRPGCPPGVLNVLTGSGSKVGAELVSQPGRPRDLVHRLGAGRPVGARRGDGARLPRPARARRPQPADRDGRRGARPRGRGGLRGRVLVGGPEVHRDAAHPRPGRRLRRVPRASCSRASPRARSATRPIRTSRSARS